MSNKRSWGSREAAARYELVFAKGMDRGECILFGKTPTTREAKLWHHVQIGGRLSRPTPFGNIFPKGSPDQHGLCCRIACVQVPFKAGGP